MREYPEHPLCDSVLLAVSDPKRSHANAQIIHENENTIFGLSRTLAFMRNAACQSLLG